MATAAYRMNSSQLNLLSFRTGYNFSLRHFRGTQNCASGVGEGFNLADLLNAALDDGEMQDFQIRSIINLLLVEKYGYACQSHNLKEKIETLSAVSDAVVKWNNIQIILVYTDSNGILHVINPERTESAKDFLPLMKDENIVCYAGSVADVPDSLLVSALSDVFKLLYGGKIKQKAGYSAKSGKKKQILSKKPKKIEPDSPNKKVVSKQKESSPSPPVLQDSSAPRKLTAKIGVAVSNELFHNGNVEAWTRIIQSYKHKYTNLDVLVWYEGERINDLNVLFKWGKVKHGVPIMFSVAGDNPKDISKLKRYLFEGASSRYEAFLQGAHGTILKLF